MARIKHPRPQLGTVKDRIGGVIFRDGFAEVDLANEPHLADAYKLHGYEVIEPVEACGRGICAAEDGHDGTCAEASGWDDKDDFTDLTRLSKHDLLHRADVEGVAYPPRASKADLIDLLSRVQPEPATGDGVQLPPYIVPLTPDEE